MPSLALPTPKPDAPSPRTHCSSVTRLVREWPRPWCTCSLNVASSITTRKSPSYGRSSAPWWEPGTKIGSHAITWGYIVGEIIRRASGKPIPQALREEVAEPLGVTNELFFAVPAAERSRIAPLEDAPGGEEMFGELPEDSPILKLGPDLSAADANRSEVLGANILAGGTGTARAGARMYAALLGKVDGVRLISAERLREVSAVAMSGTDQIFGFPTSWGLGYVIGQFMSNAHETQHVFGVGGIGGSHAYADTATGTTFALTKNRLTPNFETAEQVSGIVTRVVADS